MTNSEIIEQLDGIVGTYEILVGNGVNSDILEIDDIEAIREAIKALNAEPCEDCISRQAAIDLADELKDNLPDDDHLSDMVMAHNEGILEYQTQLSLLPSVHPECTEDYCPAAFKPTECEDCVSRKALLKIYDDRFLELQKIKHLKYNKGAEDRQMGVNYCINILKEMPSVTPAEKVGHWEQYGNSWENKFKCSECGKEQPKILCCERIIGHWSDYCPNCGAKMTEEEQNGR